MVTMRQYTPEFLESAVNLVLIKGLSARKAAENLGIPIHTIHSWVASARRGTGGLTSLTANSKNQMFKNKAYFLNDWLKHLHNF